MILARASLRGPQWVSGTMSTSKILLVRLGRPCVSDASVEPDGSLSHDGRYYIGYYPRGSVVIDTATGKGRLLNLGGQSFVMGMTWARGETAVMLAPDVSGDGRSGSVLACDASSLQCQSSEPVDNVTLIALPTF